MLEKGFKQLLAEAGAVIDGVSVPSALGLLDDPEVVFVDVREGSERAGGKIPGDVHAPRTPIDGLYLSNSIWPPGTTFLGAGYVAATVVAQDLEVHDQDWWCAEPLHWWQSFLASRG